MAHSANLAHTRRSNLYIVGAHPPPLKRHLLTMLMVLTEAGRESHYRQNTERELSNHDNAQWGSDDSPGDKCLLKCDQSEPRVKVQTMGTYGEKALNALKKAAL